MMTKIRFGPSKEEHREAILSRDSDVPSIRATSLKAPLRKAGDSRQCVEVNEWWNAQLLSHQPPDMSYEFSVRKKVYLGRRM